LQNNKIKGGIKMLDQHDCNDRLLYNELFSLFPYHIRSKLLNKAESKVAKAGQPVFLKGDPGPWLGAIMSGRVRISLHSPDKREMLISMVQRGEICGERALIDGNPRAGDAIAEEDTAFLTFQRDDLIPALHSYPEAMMYMLRVMCSRSVRYMNTMELYAMQNLPIRLANFLLFLGYKYGKESNGKLALHDCLSQTDLSRQIASSRESINRQMKQFEAQGLIHQQSTGVTIMDVAGLEKICRAA
jgi:CRP/FNR family cyclic AMP-dependent transcriptional regulator